MVESLFEFSWSFLLKSGFSLYFFTFFVYGSCSFEAFGSMQESFMLNYDISDSEVLWSYSACVNLTTSLYFTDYSPTVVSLFESDPIKVINYSTKLHESQILCPSLQNVTLNIRGSLFFIIKTKIANESFYESFQFSTTDKYKCEFQDYSSLEIHKKDNNIKFWGPERYYQIYSHGDQEDPKDSQGELGAFLCNLEFSIEKWTENCKNPSILVGRKISTESVSCILQGESFKAHRGKCYFDSANNEGFLMFTESDNNVKVSGISQTKGNYVLSIAGEEVSLHSQKVLDRVYLHGTVRNKELIGTKAKIASNNETLSCVVGISPNKVIKNLAGQKFGSVWIFVILTLCVLTILIMEIKSKTWV